MREMPLWLFFAACGSSPPDLVLVTLDTTRRDAVGAYGGPPTPGVDSLAAEGVVYAEARTVVPLTIPAHASLMTGRWPTSTGVRDNIDLRLPASEVTLAEVLTERGYDTGAAVGALMLGPTGGFEQGFSWVDVPLGVERPGDEVVDAALAWLARDHGQQPIFLWVHLYDPHAPYVPHTSGVPHGGTGAGGLEPYLGEVAFADAQIGRLLTALRARDRWSETGVVVVADHGEGRGDHGEREHGALTFASTTAVPLVTRPPGSTVHSVVEKPVSIVDVMPTMLAWASVPLPPTVDGHRLDAPASPVFVESHYLAHHLGWAPIDVQVDAEGSVVRTNRVRRYDDAEHLLTGPAGELPPSFLAHFDSAPVHPHSGGTDPASTPAMLQSLGYLDTTAPGRRVDIDPIDGIAAYEAMKDVGQALARGDEAAALAALVTVRATDPDGPTTRLLAVGLRGRADPSGALREARAIVQDWPSAEARATLGELLARAGELEEAGPYLQEAARGRTLTPGQMGLLGLALAEREDPAARDWLVRSLSAEPDQRLLRAALGRIALHAGAPDEALAWLVDEIDRYPPAVDARKALVEALLALERWPQAVEALDALDVLRAPDAGSEFGRALALHRLGDEPGSRKALAACLRRESPPPVCERAARGRW